MFSPPHPDILEIILLRTDFVTWPFTQCSGLYVQAAAHFLLAKTWEMT